MASVHFQSKMSGYYFDGEITAVSIAQCIETVDSDVRCVSILVCENEVTDSPSTIQQQYVGGSADVRLFDYVDPTVTVEGSYITLSEAMPPRQVFVQ